VFMEKPFVLDGQLERATPAAAARRLLMVNFNRRFWPEYQRLRALVQSGAIGRPAAAEFILQTDVLSWSSITRHRLSPSEGGVLYDLGSQVLDLAMTVFGQEPVSIDARIHTERWEADHVRLSLELAGGTAVHCSLAYTDHNRECAVIRGAAGTARLRDPNMAVHLERVSSSMRSLVGLCRDAAVLGYRALRRDHSMLRFSVRSALETFVRALHAGQPFSPGFDDAERNLRWLEAARRSAASGRPEALVARAREKQQVGR
jgi:predicted dehydrogenase